MALFRSIRSKIIVGVVALILLLSVALTVVAVERTRDALQAEIKSTQLARAERVAESLDQDLRETAALATSIAGQEWFLEDVPASTRAANGTVAPDNETSKRSILQQILATDDHFTSILIIDLTGRPVLAEPVAVQWQAAARYEQRPDGNRYHVIAETYFAQDPGDRAESWYRGPVPGSWELVVPLRTAGTLSTVWGLMLLEGNPAPLRGFIDAADVAAHERLFLVDEEGLVIAASAGFPAGYDLDRAMDRLADTRDGTGIVTIDDRDHLATRTGVATTGWTVVLAEDEDVAFAVVDDIVQGTVIVSLVAIAVGVVISLALGHDVGVPVRRLIDAAKRVTAGEYGTQVRVATRDEMSDLAGAFNAMSARLQEEHQRLKRQQETLEDTVAARTRQLIEKNDELEAFVYAASHDLRTPIISLDWLAQEMREQLGEALTPEMQATFDRIASNIEGMDQMITDLLELSRIGRTEGEPEAVPLAEVVRACIDDLDSAIAAHSVRLNIDFTRLPVVSADRRRMHQVFANLIGNAVKYGRATGGTVRVSARPVGHATRPDFWRIEVADDGPGIAPEHRERIFLLFQRAPDPLGRNIEGTGIGLALVRKIVRAYGGDVRVAEAPEGGALFWFTLPAADRDAAVIRRAPRSTVRGPGDVGVRP